MKAEATSMRRRTTMKSVAALLALLAGALVFLSRPVSALSGPYGDSVPVRQVPWSTAAGGSAPALTFPKFDPATGTLARVVIAVDATMAGAVKAENTGGTPNTLTLEAAADITLDTLDPAHPAQLRVADDRTVDLAAFDGLNDFAGDSGETITDLADSQSATVTITDPAVLAAFSGTGDVELTATTAEDHQTTGGDGSEDVSYQASAGIAVTVTYFVGRIDVAKGPAPTAVEGADDVQTVVPGGTASFAVRVINAGDVALTDVVVNDAAAADCQRDVGSLAPGAETSYTCSQAAVTAPMTNSATASGVADQTGVSDTDTSDVEVGNAAVEVTKAADRASTQRGGEAVFTITVVNPGDVTLDPVVVTDVDSDGVAHPQCDRTITALAPGEAESWDCTVTGIDHTTTNTASVRATVQGGAVLPTVTSSATVRVAGLTLVKRVNGEDANTAPGVGVPVGGVLEFTYDVANDGDVTVSQLMLSDDKVAENDITQIACPQTELAPGESMTCTATGTQLSVEEIMNTATITGVTAAGDTVTATDVAHHHGIQAVVCAATPDADAVEGVQFFVNGDESGAVDDLTQLQLHPGDELTMTFTGLSAGAEGCSVSLAVYATGGPVFDVADTQQLDSSATCTPGGPPAGDCGQADGTYRITVEVTTGPGQPFQVDAVTGEPLPVVGGPAGTFYSGVLNGGTDRLISAQTGSGN
jgi:uncharacterized repeat protein (TIGR01451 family)